MATINTQKSEGEKLPLVENFLTIQGEGFHSGKLLCREGIRERNFVEQVEKLVVPL